MSERHDDKNGSLVRRLRETSDDWPAAALVVLEQEAADRVEQLERELATARSSTRETTWHWGNPGVYAAWRFAAMTPLGRSRAALPANIRKTLEESNLPIEVATAIADLCESPRPEVGAHWVYAAAEAHRDLVMGMESIYGHTGSMHLLDMLNSIVKGDMSPTKACRWLGWIQASLNEAGVATLEELKAINKAASKSSRSPPAPQEKP